MRYNIPYRRRQAPNDDREIGGSTVSVRTVIRQPGIILVGSFRRIRRTAAFCGLW